MRLNTVSVVNHSVRPLVTSAVKPPPVKNFAGALALQYDHPYIAQRGIPVELARTFGVGVANNKMQVSVQDLYGDFVAYVPRVLDNSEPKYDFTNLSKTNYLYNYHRAKAVKAQAILVVEGFIGLIKVHMAGFRSVVALMGSTMSDKQLHYLTRWWEYVIIMMDGDPAGRKATEEHYPRFMKQGFRGVYKITLPERVQPDMLTSDQIRQILSKPS